MVVYTPKDKYLEAGGTLKIIHKSIEVPPKPQQLLICILLFSRQDQLANVSLKMIHNTFLNVAAATRICTL